MFNGVFLSAVSKSEHIASAHPRYHWMSGVEHVKMLIMSHISEQCIDKELPNSRC